MDAETVRYTPCPKCRYPAVPLRTWMPGEYPNTPEWYPCTECPNCGEFLVVITKNKYAERMA